MSKEKQVTYADILREAAALYEKKNADYGNSFHKTWEEEGVAMARIRLGDKLERFKRLTISGEARVKDESAEDTLIDLLNYAAMSLVELRNERYRKTRK